jgi:NDP-sugar pyrophosphorylase family protein
MSYRNLTGSEVAIAERNGCRAQDWGRVLVRDPFLAERLVGSYFSGDIRIGAVDGNATFPGGGVKPCGVYHSAIHNCEIGDNVHIARAGNVSNYVIEDKVVIDKVGQVVVECESSFGNGIELDILNEAGGRPLKIYDRLSSQIAYLLVLYRHDRAMIRNLEALVDQYVATRKSAMGHLGKSSRIENTDTVINVNIGSKGLVSGATELRDGTIVSCPEAPSMVGSGVVAKGFILLSGSYIKDGAVVSKCFVGQGVQIGKQYSAENSAFFANCEGFHGEACSIFAGPYTVTHHKSTLLIAGLFSFYNAGSGTNQSNHMYKLGPLHQGNLLRGAKTGSFSYLLWPSQVGPFSVVVGKHMTNFDAGNLPFSYITAKDDRTVITPAMNLFTVGTRRDSAKWPARDRRKDPDKLDQIHFDLFSPYIVDKSLKGIADLRDLQANTPKEKEYVQYKGALIGRLMLRTACKYYEMIVKIFLGECLIELIGQAGGGGAAARVRQRLAPLKSDTKPGNWVDVSGLMAPAVVINGLLSDICGGKFKAIEEVQERFKEIHGRYGEEKLRWFSALLQDREGIDPAAITSDQIRKIIGEWKDTRVKLNNMVLQDAQKEFDANSQIGCGIDGDEEIRRLDFEAVRGTYEGNKFVKEVRKESEDVAAQAEKLLSGLE